MINNSPETGFQNLLQAWAILSGIRTGIGIFLRGAFGYDLFNTYAFYLGTPAAQADANV